MTVTRLLLLLITAISWVGCSHSTTDDETTGTDMSGLPLFTLLSKEQTHVDFANTLTEGLNTNVLMYEYFYNGGGVAVGDLNGDGLDDIYFTGNMTANRLYLNKGNMQFEDVTVPAGVVGGELPWKTGVTMVDINGDGRLDLYVCRSGSVQPDKRMNELYINEGADTKGIPHFTEQAAKYGLNSPATSTQASFFDYDKDGDLDMFLLNHNPKLLPIFDEATTRYYLDKPDSSSGVRFYRNDKGFFSDVTEQVTIRGTALTYGLGIGVSDLNGDGWQDMYISNDYSIPDYLYINNHKGRAGGPAFTDQLKTSMGHTSHFSMGNDIADVNNDGLPDVFTLDMMPEDNHRQKLLMAPDNYEKFDFMLKVGFNHQYMRNMLHLNNGNGLASPSGTPTFSEVGQLSGISNTDWSWSPLFADYDNDGWKDLFVTNGYVRDYTNQDFLKFMGDFLKNRQVMRQDLLGLVEKIPSSNVVSYLFKNKGSEASNTPTFQNVSKQWGITESSNSNGAAYADLDNDGDLDLVVNNINKPAFIYRNESNQQLKHHYLRVNLKGQGQNTQGIGAKVMLYRKGQQQYLEQMPTRGFQSSMSPVLHFGLGSEPAIDSVRVVWLSGKQQVIKNVKADQVLTVQEQAATTPFVIPKAVPTVFEEVKAPIAYQASANTTNDFKRQPLLVNPLSFASPCMTKADVDGDGLEDVFVGGANGQAGALYMQQKGGQFIRKAQPSLEADAKCDDADAVFVDANADGHLDLYVASGGYASYMPDDPMLQDRLYVNDGKGNFNKSPAALPAMHSSKSCVRVADINGDGRPDLFVGGRVIPGRYPEIPQSYVLLNDGKGTTPHFQDATAKLAPQVQRIGMVSDAAWSDLNGDRKPDLVLVGEWMPITALVWTNGQLTDKTSDYFGKEYRGWWNKLLVDDLNGDGKPDLVVGNQGLNTQCKASDKQPIELYAKDFDDNGSIDPILCMYTQGKSYPYVFRDELLDQISAMRTRFPDYKSYADATVSDLFTEDELKGAAHLTANYLKTAYFERDATGKFRERALPVAAQNSPVYTLTALDYDGDGHKDLLMCGNINRAKLRFGKSDANYGLLLKGDGKGQFSAVPQRQSGFQLIGDVRSVLPLGGNKWLFGINQQPLKAYQVTKL